MSEKLHIMFPRTITLKNEAALTVREAEISDAAAIRRYVNKVGGETDFLTFGADEFKASLAEERAFIRLHKETFNALALVAEIEGEVVGTLAFQGGRRPRIEHTGEFGISVSKAYWGLGIGTLLIEALIDWARSGDVIRKINLRVHERNTRAIALYWKLGFMPEGKLTREFQVGGQFYDAILMGLTIDK